MPERPRKNVENIAIKLTSLEMMVTFVAAKGPLLQFYGPFRWQTSPIAETLLYFPEKRRTFTDTA